MGGGVCFSDDDGLRLGAARILSLSSLSLKAKLNISLSTKTHHDQTTKTNNTNKQQNMYQEHYVPKKLRTHYE